jgi:AAA15 family ATPase/GTPase
MKIEGCKRINVFIGYPNVGKSNILEAIATLAYFNSDIITPFSELCRLRNPAELFYDSNTKNEIIIKYGRYFADSHQKLQVGIRYLSEFMIDFVIGSPKLLDSEHKKNNRLNWDIKKNIRFGRDSIQNNETLDKVDIVSDNLESSRIFLRKYVFQSSYNQPKLNYPTDPNPGLSAPFGDNLVDIIQFDKQIRKQVSEIFKNSNLKLSIDQGNNSIKALKELDDETIFLIPFYQMADTLQRLIFHKAAIMSNENAVLLFEEPEAHMFPPYIRKFTGDVIFDKSNNQFFIATHSPVVIEDFLADAFDDLSVYLVGLKDGQTTIKRLSDEELKEVNDLGVDLLFNIESYLD